MGGENNKVEKVRNMFYKQTNIDVKRSSNSEEDFENLSTNFVSSNDTQSLKEELKFNNEKIVGLENKVKENNALLLQIDAKLDKFLNLNIFKEEKKNKVNILHKMSPAPQINKNSPIFTLLQTGSNFFYNFLPGKQIFDYSILQLDNYPFIKIINLKNNKWANILLDWGCCRNNCLNISQRGFCQKGNGIVRLRDNIAKYYLSTVKNGINRSFKIISEKGFAPSKENNNLYYFEIKIIPEIEEECGWAVEIGLFKDNSQQFRVCSNGLFCSKTCLNSPYKQIPMFGCLIKPMDVVGCGIYFPQLNNEENNSAQLFFTINGKKKGKTIFVELNDDKDSLLFYPNVSLFCCSVEANFGTNKFLYKIGEFKE
uniref:SPRY domain-containing protein n=1 Tax=Meloidogyne javanica TaxID=6303 RepID=A0A915LRB9_MELJA